jgi:hypothetical protein
MTSAGFLPGHPASLSERPERLVGLGFRRGMAALASRDPSNWEFAWQDLARTTGPDQATALVAELSLWVRAVRKCAGRRIETLPSGCPGFCRDECLAISMIAAAQHPACPALKACAFALVGSSALEEPLAAADRFGRGLLAAGQVLSPDSVCNPMPSLPARGLPS